MIIKWSEDLICHKEIFASDFLFTISAEMDMSYTLSIVFVQRKEYIDIPGFQSIKEAKEKVRDLIVGATNPDTFVSLITKSFHQAHFQQVSN